MKITFYGVRGSLPTPVLPVDLYKKVKQVLTKALTDKRFKNKSPAAVLKEIPFHEKSTYGGNTACVLLEINNEKVILDCGSGLRVLGGDLLAGDFGKGKGHARVFISHTHWDHIMGIPYFVPLFIPGNRFDFYAGHPELEERLRYQQEFKFFPVNLDYMQAEKNFFQLKPGQPESFSNYTVTCHKQSHPGVSYAYKFETGKKVFVYSSDVEYNYKNMEELQEAIEFYKNADVLIIDSQYTLVEQLKKIDYGHTSLQVDLDIANKANIKTVILFHHDPLCTDGKMAEILELAENYKKTQFPDKNFKIIAARENLTLEI
ncbi:MAG TPA: MBL fold metallo-hydrolase [Spirochaetota bacterium]|nr:MBL fold metallo-hydrolase [Spirochaetota bacterium]